MGPGTRGRSAGADDDREEGEQAVVEADEWPGYQQAAGAGAVLAGGSVHEDDRVDEEEHRRVEVHHDDVGVQLRVDDDATEDGLSQHPRHQAAAQPHEVAAAGRAEDRAEEGGGDGDGEDDGDEAVAELDEAVELQGRGQVAGRALGPVAAAQARSR